MAAKISSIGFLGAGRIATALVRGFLKAGVVPRDRIIASATTNRSLDEIKKYGINVTTDNQEVVSNSDVVWVAVKPHAVARVLREVAPCIKQDQHYIVSAAAGITLKTLEKNLPEATKVIRCMPNTPVIVRNGVTIYASGSCVTEQDRELLTGMLNEIGVSMEMQEHYMDIITGLTGCGPSYMYVMMDALADGGVYAGIPKELALKLIAYTMMGSAKMVLENGKHPQELKDDVCSPAGTSIQAVRTMERAGFRGILMDAVHAATKRALELSRLENGEDKDVYVKR